MDQVNESGQAFSGVSFAQTSVSEVFPTLIRLPASEQLLGVYYLQCDAGAQISFGLMFPRFTETMSMPLWEGRPNKRMRGP